MPKGMPFVSARRLFLAGAIGLALWLGATFLWHVTWRQGVSLAVILFLDQDFPALMIGLFLLALAAPFEEGMGFRLPQPRAHHRADHRLAGAGRLGWPLCPVPGLFGFPR